MELLKRQLYRLLIVLVLVLGLALAIIAIPLDLAWTMLVALRDAGRVLWHDVVDMAVFNYRELGRVLTAFTEAFRRGQP